MRTVAVLFARADSFYKTLPGCDVYDEARDARTFRGGAPIVAHPPCRSWGQLRHMAKPAAHERDLARFAVAQVRQWGGVLEHPARSTLWADQAMPAPGAVDAVGGPGHAGTRRGRRCGRLDAGHSPALVGPSGSQGDLALHRRLFAELHPGDSDAAR